VWCLKWFQNISMTELLAVAGQEGGGMADQEGSHLCCFRCGRTIKGGQEETIKRSVRVSAGRGKQAKRNAFRRRDATGRWGDNEVGTVRGRPA
jgi:hypothetical protein